MACAAGFLQLPNVREIESMDPETLQAMLLRQVRREPMQLSMMSNDSTERESEEAQQEASQEAQQETQQKARQHLRERVAENLPAPTAPELEPESNMVTSPLSDIYTDDLLRASQAPEGVGIMN